MNRSTVLAVAVVLSGPLSLSLQAKTARFNGTLPGASSGIRVVPVSPFTALTPNVSVTLSAASAFTPLANPVLALTPDAPASQTPQELSILPQAGSAFQGPNGKDVDSGQVSAKFFDNAGERTGSSPADGVPVGSYAWTAREIENGVVFSGKDLPTVSVVHEKAGPRAAIDGKPVRVDFVGVPDAPPIMMVLQGEGETFVVDLDNDRPVVTGTMSGEILSATSGIWKPIISYGDARFQMSMGRTVGLASLQAGDVPGPVRRFAAYMLIMVTFGNHGDSTSADVPPVGKSENASSSQKTNALVEGPLARLERLLNVVAAHRAAILSIPGVISVEGSMHGLTFIVQVRVTRLDESNSGLLPKSLGGFPVEVEISGSAT